MTGFAAWTASCWPFGRMVCTKCPTMSFKVGKSYTNVEETAVSRLSSRCVTQLQRSERVKSEIRQCLIAGRLGRLGNSQRLPSSA